jgi:hypothetical protein
MRVPRRRTAVLAIATGAAIVMTAGTASAYWNTSGSGTGAARAGNAGVLLVEPGTASSTLAPGASADVTAVIKNSADYAVLVTSVTTPAAGIPGFEDAGLARAVSTCDATHSGVTVKQAAPRSTSFVIAAHGSYAVTLSDAVTMSNDSDNSCQGMFFAVPVTVTAASAVGSTPTTPAVGTL